eukprot:TRINITY_DN9596_c0_g1_i1.p1 TRINITY_DN9596_c0_g1~~TRINITY_DN9596_c0_g1_i1.p1  ORF type:complete len:980 (+),score=160.29 TRINITY_DN9596_c0_g1_i1:101-2941(+)
MPTCPAPACLVLKRPPDGIFKIVGGCGLAYTLLCKTSGTTSPVMNAWFVKTFLLEYIDALLKREGGGLKRAIFLAGTLRSVLKLEVQHLSMVDLAGGAAAVEEDPRRLWRLGLNHVKTIKDAKDSENRGKETRERIRRKGGHDPVLKDLVLIGGGHTHVHVLLMFGMEPLEGVRLTLITRDMDTPYSGMLPGHIAGHYKKDECHIDLGRLGRFAGARIIHGEVVGMDVDTKRIRVRSCFEGDTCERPSIRYDAVSINVGCSPSLFGGLSGYEASKDASLLPQGLVTVKPIDRFSEAWDSITSQVSGWTCRKQICVVGGGAGGCELALSIQHRLQVELQSAHLPKDWIHMKLVSRQPVVCPNHGATMQRLMHEVLVERGIELILGYSAQTVEKRKIVCIGASGTKEVEFDECIWCTDGAPQSWFRDVPLDKDASGFFEVEQTLQCRRAGCAVPDIFAAGDCASIRGHPRPKAGVFAVMAGMPLSKNVRSVFTGDAFVKYNPQREFLGIIGLGHGGAIASKGHWGMRSKWLWNLKDWIDQTWMWRYTAGLPKMEQPLEEPSAVAKRAGSAALELLKNATMRCGGCGNKVGATVLSDAMQRMLTESPAFPNPEVLVGVDTPDDCAVVRQKGDKVVSACSIDFFKAFIGDPWVFGRCAALHAMSDCFAMGARPQHALAVAVTALGSDEVMTEDLFQMMSGANHELCAASCTLAGGHTTEGPESALGFSVTGVADDIESLMTKGGMKAGDVLVMTKPLGTGCIFAADMRTEARGRWVLGALRWALKSNQQPAVMFRSYRATSCTDITGFGLLGHLVEMCKGTSDVGVAARLNLDAVPLLEGAQSLVDNGIMSSLQGANFRLRRAILNEEQVAEAFAAGALPKYPLLFDPQTNGGLLVSVPAKLVDECLAELQRASLTAWRIGDVVSRPSSWESGRYVEVTGTGLPRVEKRT